MDTEPKHSDIPMRQYKDEDLLNKQENIDLYNEAVRKHTAKQYKSIRSILRKDYIPDDMAHEVEFMRKKDYSHMLLYGFFIVITVFWLCMVFAGCARASDGHLRAIEGYSINTWAEAIHHAEGNDNYGILAHYKHTSYKQACINTVRHNYKRWIQTGRKGKFIDFLACRYAPIDCENDNGTNKFWKDNVLYWLNKLEV